MSKPKRPTAERKAREQADREAAEQRYQRYWEAVTAAAAARQDYFAAAAAFQEAHEHMGLLNCDLDEARRAALRRAVITPDEAAMAEQPRDGYAPCPYCDSLSREADWPSVA